MFFIIFFFLFPLKNPIRENDIENGPEDDFDEWEVSDEEFDIKFTEYPVAHVIYTSRHQLYLKYKSLQEITRGYLVFIIFCLLYTAYFIICMNHE